MKRKIPVFILFLLGCTLTGTAHAQFTRRTVEERVALIHSKMDSAFKLEASKAAEVDSVFAQYYRASDKAREEMMASGERPGREQMQKVMEPLMETREKKLKKILPESQYEIWKKEIEPSLRPQRPVRN